MCLFTTVNKGLRNWEGSEIDMLLTDYSVAEVSCLICPEISIKKREIVEELYKK